MREATRQARYAEQARLDGAPGAPVHGSVLLRLPSDFLCYKCQQEFERERGGGDEMSDEEVTAWCERLHFASKKKLPSLAAKREAVEAERARAMRRKQAAQCAARGENGFAEFRGLLLEDECFHQDNCEASVQLDQRHALEPWYQRAGPDGSRLAPWPRVFGIPKSWAGHGGAFFSEAVESGFAADTFPQGRRGYYTGEPGDVPAELWLLRAWCRARGGVARMGDALAARLQQLEGDRDIMYRVEAAEGARRSPSGDLKPPVYLADLKPQAIPEWPVWLQLLKLKPQAARQVAIFVRRERAGVGLTWNLAAGHWDLDQQRLLAALDRNPDLLAAVEKDAAVTDTDKRALSDLGEFRARHGGVWPDAFADRLGVPD